MLSLLPRLLRRLVPAILGLTALPAFSQAIPAGREVPPPTVGVFLAGTDTHTGFMGKNGAITAGINLSLRRFYGFEPAVELRGSTSVHANSAAATERSFLGGVLLRRPIGRISPYVDYFYGGGSITYPGTYEYNGYVFVRTNDPMHAYGGGLDLRLTHSWSFKADYQLQQWSVPVLASDHAEAHAFSLGITRRFTLNPHSHPKQTVDKDDPKWHKLCDDHPMLCQK
ncbi:MAG: hypothetical protein PW735_09825 [Acidobacteriaceae bacterium]|nr:hypothetical protein [Acidobacteriaceae bacterium]